MNILIVKLSAIGDVVHTLPALSAIRKAYPKAHITWLVESAAHGVIEEHLDRIIVCERKRWIKGLRGASCLKDIRNIYRFIRILRDTRYDLVIDFQALLKSAVLIGLARGDRKIGFDRGMEHMEHSYLFLNERVAPVSMEKHALLRGMLLLEALGIESDEIEYHFPISDQDHRKAEDLLIKHGIKPSGRIVAINPIAKWETKLWNHKRFAQLGDLINARHDAGLIFTGGREDRKIIDGITSRMNTKAVNLAGKTTLKMLASIYTRAMFVVSTDSGPAHIAAAAGARVVALFGPTAPWRTGPFGNGHQIVRTDLKCSPCFERECPTKACMEDITVSDVLEGIDRLGL
jgi:3-deoxy-D-manno-octulosonic-acid transferase/heptosyltransferase-1